MIVKTIPSPWLQCSSEHSGSRQDAVRYRWGWCKRRECEASLAFSSLEPTPAPKHIHVFHTPLHPIRISQAAFNSFNDKSAQTPCLKATLWKTTHGGWWIKTLRTEHEVSCVRVAFRSGTAHLTCTNALDDALQGTITPVLWPMVWAFTALAEENLWPRANRDEPCDHHQKNIVSIPFIAEIANGFKRPY